MADELRKCTACKGRGYHHCDCWPGDCICGYGENECEECDGEGWVDPIYDDIDDFDNWLETREATP